MPLNAANSTWYHAASLERPATPDPLLDFLIKEFKEETGRAQSNSGWGSSTPPLDENDTWQFTRATNDWESTLDPWTGTFSSDSIPLALPGESPSFPEFRTPCPPSPGQNKTWFDQILREGWGEANQDRYLHMEGDEKTYRNPDRLITPLLYPLGSPTYSPRPLPNPFEDEDTNSDSSGSMVVEDVNAEVEGLRSEVGRLRRTLDKVTEQLYLLREVLENE
ncbi:hypothetical protein FRC12_021711 [Ceratobasidium sp. 428]|nr:hypothetical protein FRC09_002964 [Ceratobasidium sp. 395]KAG8794788.1 hypothetical protein FRC12_021711 [Ceratobasidium sp. 428]